MSKRKNLDNLDFEYIAKSYVKIYGSELDKEVFSEEVQAFEQPKRPEINSKAGEGGKRSVRVLKYTAIAASLIIVCVISVVAVLVVGGIIAGEENGSLPDNVQQEMPKWQAPSISLVSERFEIVDTKEDNGKVVHTVSDIYGDDAVITLSSRENVDFTGMTETFYDGRVVYVKFDSAYRLLAYEFGGTLVELSCKYDFDTLEDLFDALYFKL